MILLWISMIYFCVFTTEDVKGHPMLNLNMFEGDILLDPVLDRNAVPSDSQRWPGGRVPYLIDPYTSYDEEQLSMIRQAMAEFRGKSCIHFVEKEEDEQDYVLIFAGRGCYSKVGRAGGVQALSLGNGCFNHGTVLHELNHALGFFHEHTRSDRDEHLEIHWSAIMDSAKDQFLKLKPSENRILDPFDYDSVMLYGERTFSKDGWTKTMTAREKGRKIKDVYDKTRLSDSDVKRLNKLYQCKET